MKTDWANDDEDQGAEHEPGRFPGEHPLPDMPAPAPDELAEAGAGVPPPDLLIGGTFGLYRAPDEGFVLVTETGRGVERRHIPGKLVRLITRGPLARTLGNVFGTG